MKALFTCSILGLLSKHVSCQHSNKTTLTLAWLAFSTGIIADWSLSMSSCLDTAGCPSSIDTSSSSSTWCCLLKSRQHPGSNVSDVSTRPTPYIANAWLGGLTAKVKWGTSMRAVTPAGGMKCRQQIPLGCLAEMTRIPLAAAARSSADSSKIIWTCQQKETCQWQQNTTQIAICRRLPD